LVNKLNEIIGKSDGIFTTRDGMIDPGDTLDGIPTGSLFIRCVNSIGGDIMKLESLQKVIISGFYICFEEEERYDVCMFILRNKLTSRSISSEVGRIKNYINMESVLAEAASAASEAGSFRDMFPAVMKILSIPNLSDFIETQTRTQASEKYMRTSGSALAGRASASAAVPVRSSTVGVFAVDATSDLIHAAELDAAERALLKFNDGTDCEICVREMGIIFDVNPDVFHRVFAKDSLYIDSFGFITHPLVSIIASRSLGVDHCTA